MSLLSYLKPGKYKWGFYFLLLIITLILAGLWAFKRFNFNSRYTTGQPIDSLNGVYVYFNGGVNHVAGRNLTPDGYNLGLKYQCVEFVKRYYYQHYVHKMPDSYGHARSFFNDTLQDGQWNEKRGLIQYTNPGRWSPAEGDLLVYSSTLFNKYGHVAIVAAVTGSIVTIIQQNPGPFGQSRETFVLGRQNGEWRIGNQRILGWLRKGNTPPTGQLPSSNEKAGQ